MAGKHMEAGAWGSWPYGIHNQEAENRQEVELSYQTPRLVWRESLLPGKLPPLKASSKFDNSWRLKFQVQKPVGEFNIQTPTQLLLTDCPSLPPKERSRQVTHSEITRALLHRRLSLNKDFKIWCPVTWRSCLCPSLKCCSLKTKPRCWSVSHKLQVFESCLIST